MEARLPGARGHASRTCAAREEGRASGESVVRRRGKASERGGRRNRQDGKLPEVLVLVDKLAALDPERDEEAHAPVVLLEAGVGPARLLRRCARERSAGAPGYGRGWKADRERGRARPSTTHLPNLEHDLLVALDHALLARRLGLVLVGVAELALAELLAPGVLLRRPGVGRQARAERPEGGRGGCELRGEDGGGRRVVCLGKGKRGEGRGRVSRLAAAAGARDDA